MYSSSSKLLFAFLFSFFLLSFGICLAGKTHATQIACYQIHVKLDTEEKKLWGNEILSFVNTSKKSVDTLFLHLYPNAFQSDTTTLMKESFFPDRVKKKEKYRGFIKIESVGTSSGLDLTDKKIIHETIMKLPLPDPLPPQGRVEIEIDFMVKLPEIFVRMGYYGEDFMIGQWFPKMAVLEEDGNWNAHQYHFQSEFFADFGTYDVLITVPLRYVIAATGRLIDTREKPDSAKTLVFRAEDVHDFAWAASPDYRISKRVVDGTEVSLFYKPEHKENVDRIINFAEFALKYYSLCFGKYHYNHFTMVEAKIGLGGGAMEYPTLITYSPSRVPPEKIRLDALALFHEIAHQWWYGMVASNEFQEAWLDEGFAVYSQRRALEKRFDRRANLLDLWGIESSELDFARLSYLLDLQSDPIVKNSWEFRDYLSYRANVYSKASLVLETLRGYLGEERMNELLKEYFRRYKFKHPKTSDFIQVTNQVAGEDLSYFFQQLLFGTGICDYEVTSIESVPWESEDKNKRYRTQVVIRRAGEVVIPVEVVIELEDGETIKQIWDGKERWHKIEIETDSKIKWAIIDPDNKIALDININNNSLTARSCDSIMMKLSTHCLFWLETLLHCITCF